MSVQASEVQALVNQANPNKPSTDTADVSNHPAPGDPMANLDELTGGQAALAGKTPAGTIPERQQASPTNAAQPLSFSKSYGDSLTKTTLGDLMKMKGIGLKFGMAPFAFAGIKPLADQPTGEEQQPTLPTGASQEGGNTTWEAAQSNADQTPESTRPQPPMKGQGILDALESFAAGANAPAQPGQGAVSGFAAGIEGNLRTRREIMKDRQLMATSNATMLHEQALTHKLGEDQINAAVDSGKQGLGLMMSAHVPGTILAQGKTSDQIKDMIDKKQLDPSAQTVFLTGRVPVGRDANGQPIFRSTYTVVTPGGPIKFDKDHDDEREFLNDSLHMNLTEGQELPANQVNHLWQQALNAQATKAAVEQNLEQANLKRDQATARQAAKELDTKDFWVNALNANDASAPGHPDPYRVIKAYYALLGHGVPKEMPNFSEVFKQYVGGDKNFDILQKDYDKAQLLAQKKVTGIIGMSNKEIGQDPEGAIAAADTVLNAPKGTYTTQEIAEAQQTKSQAQTARQLKISGKAEAAGAEEKAKNSAAIESLDDKTLMDKILNFDIDPEKMVGIRGSQRLAFMSKVAQEAKNRGIDWNERDYKARYETAQDFRPKGDSGKQVISLNVFGGHTGEAFSLVPTLKNTSAKDFNEPINHFQERLGASQYARMRTALMASKDEYLNFLNAGHKPSVEEEQRADKLVDENSSPKVIHDVLQQMAQTVAIRAEALNEQYKSVFNGQDYPHMFTKRTADVMKNLGVDIAGMGGITGNYGPNPNAPVDRKDLGNNLSTNPAKKPDLVRPADLPTAVGIKQFRNKAGQVQDYWYDISGKPLRPATEMPKE